MHKMTREEWVSVTALVGSYLIMNGKMHEGMAITVISQRLSETQWNAIVENSEGTMKRTDDTTPDSE